MERLLLLASLNEQLVFLRLDAENLVLLLLNGFFLLADDFALYLLIFAVVVHIAHTAVHIVKTTSVEDEEPLVVEQLIAESVENCAMVFLLNDIELLLQYAEFFLQYAEVVGKNNHFVLYAFNIFLLFANLRVKDEQVVKLRTNVFLCGVEELF